MNSLFTHNRNLIDSLTSVCNIHLLKKGLFSTDCARQKLLHYKTIHSMGLKAPCVLLLLTQIHLRYKIMYFNYKSARLTAMFVSKYTMKNSLLILHEPIKQSFSYFHIFLIQSNFTACMTLC